MTHRGPVGPLFALCWDWLDSQNAENVKRERKALIKERVGAFSINPDFHVKVFHFNGAC